MAELSCGIVGLPNVGKSTLFNALTSNQAPASNYPFCTIDPNVGVVEVLDPRLPKLSSLSHSKKILYATTEFLDIAGLVEGASKGEGLGNAFLSHIRQTDAIVHVVRCFESADVIHVRGKVDPLGDVATINLELILADLETCERNAAKIEKQAKSTPTLQPTFNLLTRCVAHLNAGKSLRMLDLTPEERTILRGYPLLTTKPVLYAANVSEKDLPAMENDHTRALQAFVTKEHQGNRMVTICAQLEAEIAQLSPEERQPFLEGLGLQESGLQRLVKASFDMLGLITFLTTGEIETRAWTITKGTPAVEAAGKIHTDIQKGFIRAEVVSYDDFVHYGGRHQAKEAGKMRAEGKEYVVQDGDVILFLNSH